MDPHVLALLHLIRCATLQHCLTADTGHVPGKARLKQPYTLKVVGFVYNSIVTGALKGMRHPACSSRRKLVCRCCSSSAMVQYSKREGQGILQTTTGLRCSPVVCHSRPHSHYGIWMHRYTKQRSKPPPAPPSLASSHPSQASLTASQRAGAGRPPTPGKPPTPRTAAHLAAQVSATSRRVTPTRLPLQQVDYGPTPPLLTHRGVCSVQLAAQC